MRSWALALFALISTLLVSCGPREEASGGGILVSALPERGWLELCANQDRSADRARCTNQDIVWVVTLVNQDGPQHLIAHLGPRSSGVRVDVFLAEPLPLYEGQLTDRTFFLRGRAREDRDADGVPTVLVEGAQALGFQTLIDGPKQGALAPEITMAEFGRYCLLAPHDTYTEQCAGKRVLWYGLLRGAAPDGVILGLPFEGASIARIKTAEELPWPIGESSSLADQPLVIEGVLGPYIARRDTGDRVPVVNEAHIINFSQRREPVVEITGVR